MNEALTLSETCRTLNTLHDPMKVLTPLESGEKQTIYCLQGNGIDRADSAKCNGKGWREDQSYTLNTIDRPAVLVPSVCYGLDRASFNQGANAQYDFSIEEELAQTVLAKGPGGGISEKVGALCAADAKGVGNQYVNDGKIIVCNRRSPHAESK